MALLLSLILAICTGPGLIESSYRARLVGGPHRCEGRVDVEQNGQWSTVCGYNWDLKNVVVVCRELGCGAAKGTQSSFPYKPQAEENQDFFIEEFHCKGLEDTLAQCEKEDTDYGSCSHQDYAGASCEIPETVRLADGPGRCIGRVEVKHQDQWGTVCKAGWNLQAAKVVCRQLGCGKATLTRGNCKRATQGQGPIWLNQVSCSGKELTIQDCPSRPWGKNNCTHDEDTWVHCEDPFELKLEGGESHCSGRLMVLHKGIWGSVCDDGWGRKENQVVCKQLGCGHPLLLPFGVQKHFGLGVGPIWLNDVRCSGNELSLEQCRHRFWGYHDCTHKEDVAVICSGKSCSWNP
ncbi:CD5 antigen-like isoform X1 [Loxodonta africana]|uniref:CD5 antigen-like isoform X1 n=1 Tax=Loxodonta africana TaxID=9785 RepID=UPI0030D105EE